jgi:hypothetical protein
VSGYVLEEPRLFQELKRRDYNVSDLDLSAFEGDITIWQFHRYLLQLEGG